MNPIFLIYLARGKKCSSFGNRQIVSYFIPKRGNVPPFVQEEISPPKAGTCLATGAGCRWGVLSPSADPDLGSLWPFPSLYAWKQYPLTSSWMSVIHSDLLAKFSIKLFFVFSYAVLSSREEKRKTLTMTIKLDLKKFFHQTLLWLLHRSG